MEILLLIQVASTWAMVGLIWFVQVVHYPLFAKVGCVGFPEFENLHRRLTTWVVAPLMLAELGTALLLCIFPSPLVSVWQSWTGLVLVVVIWLSTALLQVPAHQALSKEFSDQQHRKLVNSNWLRTVAWSTRGILVLGML